MTTIVLEIQKPGEKMTTQSFNEGKYRIGRESGDIALGDTQISSVHGELEVTASLVTYTDLNSTNGSFTGSGARITAPLTLVVGSEVRLGGCVLKLAKMDMPTPKGKTELAPAIKPPTSIPPTQPVPMAKPQSIPVAKPAIPTPQNARLEDNPKDPSEGETSEPAAGLLNDFVDLLKWTFYTIKPHMVRAALPIALITIPVPVVVAVLGMLTFLVPMMAPLFVLLIGILGLVSMAVALCITLLLYPVIARFMIDLYHGKSPTMTQAWHQYKAGFGEGVLTTFVNVLIGGVTLGLMGVYVYQIPPAEGKSMVDVNVRSWELLKLSWKRVLIGIIGTAMLFFIPQAILTVVLGFIPIIGPILTPLVMGLITAAYVPTILLYITRIYFETRHSEEG